jgi:hypothetical protein
LQSRREKVFQKQKHAYSSSCPSRAKRKVLRTNSVSIEYEARFEAINEVLNELDCFGIRIDKEYPLDELVRRIKDEIEKAQFLIADLTDERPSCYFEAGYGEAKGKHIIYIASELSVLDPKRETKIHFDIHKNVQFFRSHKQLKTKVKAVFQKNREKLLIAAPEPLTTIEDRI